MKTWREKSEHYIALAVADLPADADVKTVRKALREAYPWGERRYHPYRMWCEEVREYLASRFESERLSLAKSQQKKKDKKAGFAPLPEDCQMQLFGGDS